MQRYALVIGCFLATSLTSSSALQQLFLNGDWIVSETKGRSRDINLSAKVPGGIYTDLMNNQIIPDIFSGFNDVNTRWVSKLSWNYTKSFMVLPNFLNHKNIVLTFEGLDTFATIYVNGQNVGSSENMFVRYDFNVKQYLKVGDNKVEVVFQSPVKLSKQLFDEQSKNYTVVPKCVPDLYNGECHANHVRKMQASFAWDWGPAFPSMGIWKDVYLTAFNSSTIKDVSVFITPNDENYTFNVRIYFMGNKDLTLWGQVMVSIKTESQLISNFYEVMESTSSDEFVTDVQFTIAKAEFNLWWPNGYGKQPLYDVLVQFSNVNDVSEKTIRIGIRTVEVVQEPIGNAGMSFYFKVNGVPIFAKGSNMIPSHILPENSNNGANIRYLLQSAKDVHMNMLRIWGGGMYESDKLYEIADEMGIMIWQDFMFACSMYPANPEFLRTVEKEATHQVRRLQYHPSLVLWAGNNENEAALRFNWYGSASNYSIFEDDYRKLYADTLSKIVSLYDPSRKYLVSSPTNGLKSEKEGHVAKNPQDNSYGDIHFYNYIFDGWDQNIYPIPRFSSEYGYQSLPSVFSILKATQNLTNLSFKSDFLIHRQHHPLGYLEMLTLIQKRMKMPTNSSIHNINYSKAFIFYSQIFQAMAIKVETEHYRQWRSYLNNAQLGHTMGALYWQLNDVWIGPTWSGIDFTGRWKMLHYFAKDFFSPIIATSHLAANGDLNIFVVSDNLRPALNVDLNISVYNWNSFNVVHSINKTVDIFTGSKIEEQLNLNNFLGDIEGCGDESLKNCFLQITLTGRRLQVPVHTVFPVPLKDCNIKSSNLKKLQIKRLSTKKFAITITTDVPAVFVWMESLVKGKFSENGFHMIQPQKTITFNIEEPFSGKFSDTLLVTHLMDKLYFQ